ncbi:MAG: protease complex subunit PrcB family protein [Marinobacter sp.]|uniref:protease complex subunit PrcB family protein n=1 Tax=Marinobacter sp. TaxID=50741 RepID=UPI003F96AAB6
MAVGNKGLASLPLISLLAGSALLIGCAAPDTAKEPPREPLVRQVIQSAHCGLTGPGLAYVQTPERLQKLLELPTQNMAVQQLRQVNLEQEHLLFVTLGEKPTGGYSISLASAENLENTLHLSMTVRSPAPGTMVTQAITSPCAVVAVPAKNWPEIRVSGIRDHDIVVKH